MHSRPLHAHQTQPREAATPAPAPHAALGLQSKPPPYEHPASPGTDGNVAIAERNSPLSHARLFPRHGTAPTSTDSGTAISTSIYTLFLEM